MRTWIIILLILGWLCVLSALALPLLAVIQVEAVGLAFMVSSLVVALWPERRQ